MKKFVLLVSFCLFSCFDGTAQLVPWQEGTHYRVIADEASEKPVVKEFFSFWCPACFRFEPAVAEIKKALPENTKFQKVHVDFMQFTSQENQQLVTKAMLLGKALKVEDKINSAIFDYIHIQRANIENEKDIRNIFVVNGISGEKFDKVFPSMGLNNLLTKNNKQVEEFKPVVRGVPSFIINDKYQVLTGAANMSFNDYIELIVWLSAQK